MSTYLVVPKSAAKFNGKFREVVIKDEDSSSSESEKLPEKIEEEPTETSRLLSSPSHGDHHAPQNWEVIDSTSTPLTLATLQSLLTALLAPAISGIPHVLISAESRAEELMAKALEQDSDPIDLMIRNLRSKWTNTSTKIYRDVSTMNFALDLLNAEHLTNVRSNLILDFFFSRIPIINVLPVNYILQLFTEIRTIAVVAAIYGSDLSDDKIKQLILLSLIPSSYERSESTTNLSDTAKTVAKQMLPSILTHLVPGAQLVTDAIWLGSNLVDAASFTLITETPVMRARKLFRPQWVVEGEDYLFAFYLLGALFPVLMTCLSIWKSLLTLILIILGTVYGLRKYLKSLLVNLIIGKTKLIALSIFTVQAFLPAYGALGLFKLLGKWFLIEGTWKSFLVFMLCFINVSSLTLKYKWVCDYLYSQLLKNKGRIIEWTMKQLPTLSLEELDSYLTKSRLGITVIALPMIYYDLWFAVWIISSTTNSYCVAKSLNFLQRKENIFRLVGVDMLATISMKFMSFEMLSNLLESINFHPSFVCGLFVMKKYSVLLGGLSFILPSKISVIIGGDFISGFLLGFIILVLFLKEWSMNDFNSKLRLFFLLGDLDEKLKQQLIKTGKGLTLAIIKTYARTLLSRFIRRTS
jgi:hypothetical protein